MEKEKVEELEFHEGMEVEVKVVNRKGWGEPVAPLSVRTSRVMQPLVCR